MVSNMTSYLHELSGIQDCSSIPLCTVHRLHGYIHELYFGQSKDEWLYKDPPLAYII